MTQPPAFDALLASHRPALVRWLTSHASGLLRFETEDDLVQGIHARALGVQDKLEYRGEREFFGWLVTIAAQYVSNRQRHWQAARRDGGAMLRLTAHLTQSGPGGGVDPATQTRGPATRAERREQLSLAARAIALLPERDQQLVRWHAEDVDLNEVARRLGVTYDAAERARLRAVDRFRKAYALVEKRG